jgi:hypothetical protein
MLPIRWLTAKSSHTFYSSSTTWALRNGYQQHLPLHCIADIIRAAAAAAAAVILPVYYAAHAANQVAYGQIVTYRWLVPDSAGPGPADAGSIMWKGHDQHLPLHCIADVVCAAAAAAAAAAVILPVPHSSCC